MDSCDDSILIESVKRLKLIVSDVDGCLSNGKLIYDGGECQELKVFDVKDGFAVHLARRFGIETAIITGRESKALSRRVKELGIQDCFQGYSDKASAWKKIKQKYSLKDSEIAFLGDDLLDLNLLQRSGVSFAPIDAVADVKERVDVQLKAEGGSGAFREMVEMILKVKGKWKEVLEVYL